MKLTEGQTLTIYKALVDGEQGKIMKGDYFTGVPSLCLEDRGVDWTGDDSEYFGCCNDSIWGIQVEVKAYLRVTRIKDAEQFRSV